MYANNVIIARYLRKSWWESDDSEASVIRIYLYGSPSTSFAQEFIFVIVIYHIHDVGGSKFICTNMFAAFRFRQFIQTVASR